MKLPVSVVESFEDIQRVFEWLAIKLGNVPDFAAGSTTITWPGGSPYSNTVPVGHDLGGVPRSPQATADLPAGGFAFEMSIVGVSATNVDFRGHTTDGAVPVAATARTFYYLIAL